MAINMLFLRIAIRHFVHFQEKHPREIAFLNKVAGYLNLMGMFFWEIYEIFRTVSTKKPREWRLLQGIRKKATQKKATGKMPLGKKTTGKITPGKMPPGKKATRKKATHLIFYLISLKFVRHNTC